MEIGDEDALIDVDLQAVGDAVVFADHRECAVRHDFQDAPHPNMKEAD